MRKIICLISFVFLLLLIENVLALGVTPAKSVIDFEPIEKEVSFRIINSEHKDIEIKLNVEGELADRITLESYSFNMSKDEDTKEISHIISLDESLGEGLHKGEIIITESSNIKSLIGARVAVAYMLEVYVPHSGSYAEAEVYITESEQGIVFDIPIINRGKTDLNEVKLKIDIYDSQGIKIESIESDTVSLGLGERSKTTSIFNANLKTGEYNAIITLEFDGELIKIERKFVVEKEEIEIDKPVNEIDENQLVFILLVVLSLVVLVNIIWLISWAFKGKKKR